MTEDISMRDKIKDADYFNKFIEEDTARVNNFIGKLERGEVDKERILPVKARTHDLKLGILTAKYSRGDDLLLLERNYLELLDEWEAVWESDYYNKNLKMISLGILFGADKAFAKKIIEMLEDANINDWLLFFLLDSWAGLEENEDKKLLFPKSFSRLQKVVSEDNKAGLLKEYLSKDWYNKDCGCHEAHKSKQNIYYGYWSFESGAISKVLSLNDDDLKGVPYYPYDLVHYKYD